MLRLSRREFVMLSAALAVAWQLPARALEGSVYPATINTLQQAFQGEMTAHNHYQGYTGKALQEGFPNIAYVFCSFAVSEKIHADNYSRILTFLGAPPDHLPYETSISTTQTNLETSAQRELEKIDVIYPRFVRTLETESYDDAILNCLYAWKSHRQHEQKVKEIHRYAGLFFSSVVKSIEGKDLDFHVCDICGSTIDRPPSAPCEICNKSQIHYLRVPRPLAPS